MIQQLKGLNTLRALAALIVVWGHVEYLKQKAGIPNLIDSDFSFFPDGHIAVILFFVLSGFLITYLLSNELNSSNTINFRRFYRNRILRIWPLFYFILIVSYLLFQPDLTVQTHLLCFTIFPNLADAWNIEWIVSPQVWSIGVEEQFYLVWPFVFYLLPKKKVLLFLSFFIVFYALLPHLLGYLNVRIWNSQSITSFTGNFFHNSKFSCIAIGAFFGFLYVNHKEKIRIFFSNYISFSLLFLTLTLWFLRVEIPFFTDELFALLFGISLLGIVENKQLKIETRWTHFLGEISYGIYLFHWIVILIVMKYLPVFNDKIHYNLALYFFVFSGTILLSWISNRTLERFFLKMKQN
ncbi:MAG: acyltransferase family protein [Fluviicola sp.]